MTRKPKLELPAHQLPAHQLPALGAHAFEDLKRRNEHDAEYWSARELQPLLGYSQWRRFAEAIRRAIESCQSSGNNPDYHFADAGKPIPGGKGAVQVVDDFHLSRFACYLIAQNGDPRKPEIANGGNMTMIGDGGLTYSVVVESA